MSKRDALSNRPRRLYILGTRGIPAAHGGFETFAEHLSIFLAERGWDVSVYCQEDGASGGEPIRSEAWRGINQLIVPVRRTGPLGTIEFDWKCIRHARADGAAILLLGYNTGIFSPMLRFSRNPLLINMDGIEWKRSKWSRPVRAWFWINERIAALFGQTLIADHPGIAEHLATRGPVRKIVMIPYGAPEIDQASEELLSQFGLTADRYLVSICRIEPENSVLEVVRAFSSVRRNRHLVVLGKIDPTNAYHRAVQNAASPEVKFVGAIYEQATLRSLRFHARAYCHGHTVGGTNPSLVEALGAGSAVLAHDNRFNRWTAGGEQFFFDGEQSCEALIGIVFDDDSRVAQARAASKRRFHEAFQLDTINVAYERLLASKLSPQAPSELLNQEETVSPW